MSISFSLLDTCIRDYSHNTHTHTYIYIYIIYIYIYIYTEMHMMFPDFFRNDTFIDSTHMKL